MKDQRFEPGMVLDNSVNFDRLSDKVFDYLVPLRNEAKSNLKSIELVTDLPLGIGSVAAEVRQCW